jgi:Protein of unknown function (DUF3592)
MPRATKIVILVVALIGISIEAFLLGSGLWGVISSLEQYTQLSHYAQGHCTILSWHVLTNTLKNRTTYRPQFTYSVQTASGQHYEATGYSVDTSYSDDQAGLQAIIDRYALGKSYPCWYNPTDPSQAFLSRDLPTGSLTLFALTALSWET